MNIPNYKVNPFLAVDFFSELRLLDPGGMGTRLVSRRWAKAALSTAYGTYHMLEHQLMLAACMEARVDASIAKEDREAEEEAARLVCSFCGKDEDEATLIIKGPESAHDCWVSIQTVAGSTGGAPVVISTPSNICDECVVLCAQIIADHRADAETKTGEAAGTGPAHSHKEQSS